MTRRRLSLVPLCAALGFLAHCGDSNPGEKPGADTSPSGDASDSLGDDVRHDTSGEGVGGDVQDDTSGDDGDGADGDGEDAHDGDDAVGDGADGADGEDGEDGAGGDVVDATSEGDATGDAPDAVICNTFGCSCGDDAECQAGLCVESLDGRICTEVCLTSCPSDDFACLPVAIGDGPETSLCVPRHPHVCKPCRVDAECANALDPEATALCLLAADPKLGRFCASACGEGVPCPDGFTCGEVPLADGGSARQCLPTDGTCECRPAWSGLDLVTDCERESAFGVCDGTRSCGADGLTACDAPEAALEACNLADDDCNGAIDDIAPLACDIANASGTCPGTLACDAGDEVCVGRAPSDETCNLADDDCDGATDEATCEDALACTGDTCGGEPGAAACEHPVLPGFCLIAGVCVAENTLNPESSCQRCVSAVSTTSWTGAGVDASCHIDGECFPAGAGKPGEPCFRCRPEVSGSSWSPAAVEDAVPCDDQNACTRDDTCSGASCAGIAYSCGDGLDCTDDVCAGDGTCRHPLKSGRCLIAGTCYATGARPDATTCRVCDAAKPSEWSAPATALTCDDGNGCTTGDACNGAACTGTPFSCDDQKPCTTDTCSGDAQCSHTPVESFCFIGGQCWQNGASDPQDPCHICVSPSPGGWTSIIGCQACAVDADCADVFSPPSNQCLVPACVNGMCAEVLRDCADSDACTIDGCDPHAGCYHQTTYEADGALGYRICPGALTQVEALAACEADGMTLASFDSPKEADAFDELAASYALDAPWVATASGVTCGSPKFRVPPQDCRTWNGTTDPACSELTPCGELHPFMCQRDCDDLDPCTADSVDTQTGACVHKAQACDCTPECVPGQCGMVDGCGHPCGCGDEEYCDAGQCQSVHFQGNSCLKPDEFAQDQFPLSAHGDISPASPFTSEYSSALCGATEARDGRYARDQVWSFVAPVVGDYEVTVTPDNAYGDLQVYAAPFDQCDTVCTAWADDTIQGESETLTLTATIPNQYFNLIVDGATPLTEDGYTITIASDCQPACAADACNVDDGCGGTCVCEGSEVCNASNACVLPSELPGNMCNLPRALTADVQATGDIRPASLLTADYSAASCSGASPNGAASIDEVWVFTAPTADAYLVTATPTTAGADLILYQFSSAACDTTCVQYTNLHGVGGDESTVAQPTSAGQVFYIIVDATAAGTGGAYTIKAYAL